MDTFTTELSISTNYEAPVTQNQIFKSRFSFFKNRTCMISKNGAESCASRRCANKLPLYIPRAKSNEAAAASLLILKVLKLHVSRPPGTTDSIQVVNPLLKKSVLQCFCYLVQLKLAQETLCTHTCASPLGDVENIIRTNTVTIQLIPIFFSSNTVCDFNLINKTFMATIGTLSLHCTLGCTHPEYLSKAVTRKTTGPLQQKRSEPHQPGRQARFEHRSQNIGKPLFCFGTGQGASVTWGKPLMSLGFRGRVQVKAGGRADLSSL